MIKVIISMVKALVAIGRGLKVTFVNLWRMIMPAKVEKGEEKLWRWSKLTRSGVTLQYPEERWEFTPRFRGWIRLVVDQETGEERCVGCGICASVCPAFCIEVEMEEIPADERRGKRKTRPKRYQIDFSKCMFCGSCVENCPFDALTLTHEFEHATYDRIQLIFDKDKLLLRK